jgi:hypothetical protein
MVVMISMMMMMMMDDDDDDDVAGRWKQRYFVLEDGFLKVFETKGHVGGKDKKTMVLEGVSPRPPGMTSFCPPGLQPLQDE